MRKLPDEYENVKTVPMPVYRVYLDGIVSHVFGKGHSEAALEIFALDPERRQVTCQLGDGPEWVVLPVA